MEFEELALTDRFKRSLASFDKRVQKQAWKALRFLLNDPSHPSLQFKPIHPDKYYWEARVNQADRLVIRPDANVAHVIDIVEHDDIDRWGRA